MRAGPDRLDVPVRALDQPDLQRKDERVCRPLDEIAEVVERVDAVRLHDATELRAFRVAGPDFAQQLVRRVLQFVVLGIEVDRRVRGACRVEDRPEPVERFRDPFVRGCRREQRRQRAGLHRDVDPRHVSPRVVFERRARVPSRSRACQRVEHRPDPLGVRVGVGEGERPLAEQVDRVRVAAVPQLGDSRDGFHRVRAPDELPRHAMDATARHAACGSGAERERVRGTEPGPHDPRCVLGEDVLVEMVEHVVRGRARGEDVDEPEQAGLEVRPLRRPGEQAGVDVDRVPQPSTG